MGAKDLIESNKTSRRWKEYFRELIRLSHYKGLNMDMTFSLNFMLSDVALSKLNNVVYEYEKVNNNKKKLFPL